MSGDVEPITEADLGPTAREVRRRIAALITQGSLRPGQKLAPERELAAEFGVSRATLRQGLSALETDGVVRRLPGRGGGTFVNAAKVDRDLSNIIGLPNLLREQGFTAGTRVVSVAVAPAEPEVATALSLGTGPDGVGEFVVTLVRIRLADGCPVSLESAVLPAHLVPGLPERALSGSLYELLDREYGLRPANAIEHIEVIAASAEHAKVLDVAVGAPLLQVERTTVDEFDRPFEFSRDLFRADRVRITVKVSGSVRSEAATTR